MNRILYVGNKLSAFGFTPTGVEFLGKVLRDSGFAVITAGDKRNKLVRLGSILRAVIARRRDYEIILIDTYSTQAFYFAFVTAFIAGWIGKPFVPILRGGGLPDRLKQTPLLLKFVLENAIQIVSPSNYLKSYFEEHGFKRLQYIPNPIPMAEYTFALRSTIRPFLFWVRSFHSIYNPQMALLVLKGIKVKYPQAKLCMVGPDKDGSLGECRNLANALGVEGAVIFTGLLSKPEWHSLSKGHDIFINTTNFDNAPVSVMEAMALGLAVISTNVGGIPFLLTDKVDSLLVKPGNVDEMVAAIVLLVENASMARDLTSNARSKVEEFDDRIVTDQWRKLLNG